MNFPKLKHALLCSLIAKDTIAGIKYLIDTYFSKLGYTTKYIELE